MTTITIERELLVQAVEKLLECWPKSDPCINAIRAALAAPATAPEPTTAVAVTRLCKALREDLDYAWGWHCNIAMTAFDAGCPHDVANEGAAQFLELLARVDTRKHPGFQETQDNPMRNAATAPAWQDAPTVPGIWLNSCDGWTAVMADDESDWENAGMAAGRWYGPIPPNPRDKP